MLSAARFQRLITGGIADMEALNRLPQIIQTNKQFAKSIQVTLAALREFCGAAEEAMVPASIVYNQKTYPKRRR
ncbi:hypothetical protein D6D08_10645 [Aureobasidium pullulans]|nr:hypothetical protein D6D08_10645 [Aureobasidium pullulans]